MDNSEPKPTLKNLGIDIKKFKPSSINSNSLTENTLDEYLKTEVWDKKYSGSKQQLIIIIPKGRSEGYPITRNCSGLFIKCSKPCVLQVGRELYCEDHWKDAIKLWAMGGYAGILSPNPEGDLLMKKILLSIPDGNMSEQERIDYLEQTYGKLSQTNTEE